MRLVVLVLSLMLGTPVLSQPAAFPADRRCVFTCISWGDAAGPLHYRTLERDPKAPVYFTIDKPTPLVMSTGSTTVPSGFRSEPQPYLGPPVLEFYSIPPPAQPTEKDPLPSPVARVFIPPHKERVMLVFTKVRPSASDPGIRHEIQLLPDGLDEVPMGGYLLVNTTSKRLIGSVDTTAFELGPRTHQAIKSPADKPHNLEWRFWNETKQERPLYSSVWNHRPDGRSLIFITDSVDQRNALNMRAIQEIGGPAKPKKDPPPLPK